MSKELEKAFEAVKKAIKEDNPEEPGSLARSLHGEVAMACLNAFQADDDNSLDYETAKRICSDGADRYLKVRFGIDTKGVEA